GPSLRRGPHRSDAGAPAGRLLLHPDLQPGSRCRAVDAHKSGGGHRARRFRRAHRTDLRRLGAHLHAGVLGAAPEGPRARERGETAHLRSGTALRHPGPRARAPRVVGGSERHRSRPARRARAGGTARLPDRRAPPLAACARLRGDHRQRPGRDARRRAHGRASGTRVAERGVSSRIRLAIGVLALVAVACGPPINVKRVPPRTVTAELARSALNSKKESLFSENVLYRWNLTQQYEDDPEGALRVLHDKVVSGEGGRAALFALAELSFEQGDRTRRRDWYLASAVYAYAFLFPAPGAPPEQLPGELDPRSPIAADLYNRGLTEGFASPDGSQVLLQAGVYPLPFGQQLVVRLDPAQLQWADRTLFDFVPVAELKVSGLGAGYRRRGIGGTAGAAAVLHAPTSPARGY